MGHTDINLQKPSPQNLRNSPWFHGPRVGSGLLRHVDPFGLEDVGELLESEVRLRRDQERLRDRTLSLWYGR